MRLAHLADLHLTNSKDDSQETIDEQVNRLCWIAKDAKENEVDLIAVAGDTFHSRSNAEERNAAIHVYRRLAEAAPVVVVKGNNSHDGPGEIAFLDMLRTKHRIEVAERPWAIHFEKCFVLAMPFPEKQWLAAASAANGNAPGSMTQRASEALRALFLHWAVKAQESKVPVIFIGHLELGGATLDSGQPAVGKCFVEMNEADLLEIGADYYALGHIHKHQTLAGCQICYAGSPRQTTFGEDFMKGYCLVDIPGRHCVDGNFGSGITLTHRKTPGPELITLNGQWIATDLTSDGAGIVTVNQFDWGKEEDPSGQIMRLVYEVDSSEREQAATAAAVKRDDLLANGARSVKIDARVVATTRVRSEALRDARTNADRLNAWWSSREETPIRAASITSKLNELEDAVANG